MHRTTYSKSRVTVQFTVHEDHEQATVTAAQVLGSFKHGSYLSERVTTIRTTTMTRVKHDEGDRVGMMDETAHYRSEA